MRNNNHSNVDYDFPFVTTFWCRSKNGSKSANSSIAISYLRLINTRWCHESNYQPRCNCRHETMKHWLFDENTIIFRFRWWLFQNHCYAIISTFERLANRMTSQLLNASLPTHSRNSTNYLSSLSKLCSHISEPKEFDEFGKWTQKRP
jgi:hypothetical protein